MSTKTDSKMKKCLRHLGSFCGSKLKEQTNKRVDSIKMNQSINPQQKPDFKNILSRQTYDTSRDSRNTVNPKFEMNPYQYTQLQKYKNNSSYHSVQHQKDANKSVNNSTMFKDEQSFNKKKQQSQEHTMLNNGKQYPIIVDKKCQKFLENLGQLEKKKQPTKEVCDPRLYGYEAQSYRQKKIYQTQHQQSRKNVMNGWNDNDNDNEMQQFLNLLQLSEIRTQSIQKYYPQIKNLKHLTTQQLKYIICYTIRQEMRRAKNPLLSNQEKDRLHERHRDIANHLKQDGFFFNQNIFQQNGPNGFGNVSNGPQKTQTKTSIKQHNLQSILKLAINFRDRNPQGFKELLKKIETNSKSERQKQLSHNLKMVLFIVTTVGSYGIKVAKDSQHSSPEQLYTLLEQNGVDCGKAILGSLLGKMIGQKIHHKYSKVGAVVGAVLTSEKIKKTLGKGLQKTGKYIGKYAKNENQE